MWTYTNGTIAKNAFNALETTLIKGITYTGDDGQPHTMTDKYILIGDSTVILAHGKATVAGMDYAGRFIPATSIVAGSDTIVWNSMITSSKGVARYGFGTPIKAAGPVIVNGTDTVAPSGEITLRDHLSTLHGSTRFTLAGIVTRDPHSGETVIEEVSHVTVPDASTAGYRTVVELNTESTEYNDAGNWVGILFAVQAIGSVIWPWYCPCSAAARSPIR